MECVDARRPGGAVDNWWFSLGSGFFCAHALDLPGYLLPELEPTAPAEERKVTR